MSNALKLISDGQKIRAVARSTSIPFTTLYRYHKKVKNNPDPEKPIKLTPNYAVHKLFTDEQERNIVDYIVSAVLWTYHHRRSRIDLRSSDVEWHKSTR